MKKLICLIIAALVAFSVPVAADTGERGVSSGITEGISLPLTTAQLLATSKANSNRRIEHVLNYTEMVFLSGKAEKFEGTLTYRQQGVVSDSDDMGTYKVTYTVAPNAGVQASPSINRTMELSVNYRKVRSADQDQLILDYSVTNWTETIVAGGTTYTLVPKQSYFGRSIIKDITPGVTYYKGETSMTAYYTGAANPTTVETSGSIYGYDCAWSKTETERLNVVVNNGAGWQLEAQVRPSVSVNKVLQYSPNEPTAISFDGNYYEVLKNRSNVSWNIFTMPLRFQRGAVYSGAETIPNTNKFEMLPAPDLAFLKGHFAESDIKKLFAMQILEGNPSQFKPEQAMTRAQFVVALAKAFKIKTEEPQTGRNQKNQVVTVLFPDVQSNRPDFQWLMAAYKNGLVYGRYQASSDNRFRPDDAITMEEAIVILTRGLGLENLGLTPTTVTIFADDAQISSWAKREISAAQKIGIIDMDANGNINPQKKLTKAEAAALINRTVDYMRLDLPEDYVEHILNFAN